MAGEDGNEGSAATITSTTPSRRQEISPLGDGVAQVRRILERSDVLKGKVDTLLPSDEQPVQITREDYIHDISDEDYPSPDGHLYEVTFPDGRKTYILHHRTNKPFVDDGRGNPWANMEMYGGFDMRPWETFVYAWDGKTTIEATDPKGKTTTVSGEYGVPDQMLPTLRKILIGSNLQEIKFPTSRLFTDTPQPQTAANS